MRTRNWRIVISLAVVTTIAAAVTVAGASAPSLEATSSKLLTHYDQDQLGLHLTARPTDLTAARVSALSASKAAAAALGTGDTPAEVLHAMVAPDASSAERSVYVVIFSGGEPLPGGPEGNQPHATVSRGVVIDDSTGEVLRLFAMGDQ